jgi:hypothetical protein
MDLSSSGGTFDSHEDEIASFFSAVLSLTVSVVLFLADISSDSCFFLSDHHIQFKANAHAPIHHNTHHRFFDQKDSFS